MKIIDDPGIQKTRLLEDSERYKEEFTQEITDLTGKIERGIITGLIVGGLAYITYRFVKGFGNKKEENVSDTSPESADSKNNAFNHVAKYLAETAALLLINLAKEKLLTYLKERNSDDEDSPENP